MDAATVVADVMDTWRAGIDAGIARVLDNGRLIQGPEVDELEAKKDEIVAGNLLKTGFMGKLGR